MTALVEGAAPRPVAPPAAPFSASLLRSIVIAWLVLCALQLALHWGDITAHRFPDPDDMLRLVEVRNLLGGQSWFDVHQYRVDPPLGVPMHWSRLVDIPLAGLILILRPLLGAALAETVTLVAVPLITLLCAVALIARLAHRLLDAETATIAGLITGLAAPAMYQMQPMRIDHHAWQIVLMLAALNGLAARDARNGGLVIGISLATSLAISLENLPLAAIFIAVCGLRFLRDRDNRGWLLWSMNALAVGSVFFFLATRGLTDLAQHCDEISPYHLAIFAWGAIGCSALVALRPKPLVITLGLAGVIGAGALAIVLTTAPQCTHGAFASLDPVVRKYWLDAITEGLPVWNMPVAAAVTMIAMPLIGLIGALRLRARAENARETVLWTDIAIIIGGALAIGIMVSRASATACLLAVVPAAWQVHHQIVHSRKLADRPLRQIASYLLIALMLIPALPVLVVAAMLPAQKAEALSSATEVSACDYDKLAAGLNRLAPSDIFMPMDKAPMVLLDTAHSVVATGHHRANLAMRDVIEAFLDKPAEARPLVAKHRSSLLLLCPDEPEVGNYAHYAPHGFAADLLAGRTPDWLEKADLAPGSGFLVYRVKKPGQTS